jgi:hypothetical protein
MKTLTNLFTLIFLAVPAFSQDSIPYSKDFILKEGIYLSYSDFSNNDPIEKNKIITSYNKNEIDFFANITSKEIIRYDSLGKQTEIKTKKIWGYCQGRTVFLNFADEFNRVPIIGSICHFTARVASSSSMGIDPFGGVMFSVPLKETRQFIIDTKDGKIYDFNIESMTLILQRDAELYAEFSVQKKRKKNETLFLYLRKYNEKHPLYFR